MASLQEGLRVSLTSLVVEASIFQSNESINLVERVSGGRVIARGESKGSPYPLSVVLLCRRNKAFSRRMIVIKKEGHFALRLGLAPCAFDRTSQP